MIPEHHIRVTRVGGSDLYEIDETMARLMDRADADGRMTQLHMAFEATDDPVEHELLLSEMMRRFEQLSRLEEMQ